MNNRGTITLKHYIDTASVASVLTDTTRFVFHKGLNNTVYAEWDEISDVDARPAFRSLAVKLSACTGWTIENVKPVAPRLSRPCAWDDILEEMAREEFYNS